MTAHRWRPPLDVRINRAAVVVKDRWDKGLDSLHLIADECPLLAQSGHQKLTDRCPLSGAKRTSQDCTAMSGFDPKRTSATCSDAMHSARTKIVLDFFSSRRLLAAGRQEWARTNDHPEQTDFELPEPRRIGSQ